MEKVVGKIVGNPLVLKDEYQAIVLIMVKTDKGCREFYRNRHITSMRKLINTTFSRVALSAIGDDVELDVSGSEIYDFKNLTHGY
jgi:capsular polysaccharide biosynthesis protein